MEFKNKTKAFWNKYKWDVITVGSGAAIGAVCLVVDKIYKRRCFNKGMQTGLTLGFCLMAENLKMHYPDKAEEMWEQFGESFPKILEDTLV